MNSQVPSPSTPPPPSCYAIRIHSSTWICGYVSFSSPSHSLPRILIGPCNGHIVSGHAHLLARRDRAFDSSAKVPIILESRFAESKTCLCSNGRTAAASANVIQYYPFDSANGLDPTNWRLLKDHQVDCQFQAPIGHVIDWRSGRRRWGAGGRSSRHTGYEKDTMESVGHATHPHTYTQDEFHFESPGRTGRDMANTRAEHDSQRRDRTRRELT